MGALGFPWVITMDATDLLALPALAAPASASLGDTRKDPLSSLHALSRAIGERVAYHKGATTAASSVEDVLAAGKGVCQDHAHVFVSAARVLGLPARYVSGYLMMDEQVDQDATHAWGEAYVPGLGWVGFDVSNEVCPDERYVRVATGLDYQDAAPISGLRVGSASESMVVAVQVSEQ